MIGPGASMGGPAGPKGQHWRVMGPVQHKTELWGHPTYGS